jgi:hypothetical protein
MRAKLEPEPRRNLRGDVRRSILDQHAANGKGVGRGDDALIEREGP